MVVAGAIVLDYVLSAFSEVREQEKRVRGGSTSRQEFGLGAIVKKARSGQGQENVLQAPG
jgi:hypothetical protein